MLAKSLEAERQPAVQAAEDDGAKRSTTFNGRLRLPPVLPAAVLVAASASNTVSNETRDGSGGAVAYWKT